MHIPTFVLGEQVDLEESMTCEFKEIVGQSPVQAIGKVIDEYVVAFLNARGGSLYWGIRNHDRRVVGVRLDGGLRDQVRQVAGQKIAAIAPPIAATGYDLPFHQVFGPGAQGAVEDTFVVEMAVRATSEGSLYLTGGGSAYLRTLGGTKKLAGAELLAALLQQLQRKAETTEPPMSPDLARMPSVARRAKAVRPLLRGARILWVDDHPVNNLYERTALASVGISTDLAVSTAEALYMVDRLDYDLVLSDMEREGNPVAGRELLDGLLRRSSAVPLIYYVGRIDKQQGTPIGAFGIANRPDEVLHLVFDALERRCVEAG